MRSYYSKNIISLITILMSTPSTVIASDIEGGISEKKIYDTHRVKLIKSMAMEENYCSVSL